MYCINKLCISGKTCGLTLPLIALTGFILLTSVAFAEDYTYDEKLEVVSQTEQIISHVISAINATKYDDFSVAKIHLMHPIANQFPKIKSIISEQDFLLDRLELILKSLTYVEPGNNDKLIHHKLAPIFQILMNTEEKIVEDELKRDPIFKMKLVVILLEKSLEHFEDHLKLEGVEKTTKKQDSFSLAIKSKMILFTMSDNRLYEQNIHNDFEDLFFLYQINPDQIPILENKIIDKINMLIKTTTVTTLESIPMTEPVISLKTIQYSNSVLVELHGENFAENQKISIKYFSPLSDTVQIIKGKTTSEGVFYLPLEFTSEVPSDPYLFTIFIGEHIFYETMFPE